MFSRRESIVLGVLFVAFLGISLVLGPVAARNNPDDPRLSTLRASANGARAAYRTLEELGVPVAQLETSLAVRGLPDGPIALLAPAQPLIPEEVGRVMDWLREGGQLLYVHGAVPPGTEGQALLDSLGLESVRAPGVPGDDALGSLLPAPHRWTAGLDSLPTARRTLRTDSLRELPTPITVVAWDSLPVVVEAPIGAGRAIVWADPAWLRNESVRENSAPVVLLARIARELTDGGAPLHFDEYHHGYRAGGGPLRTTLRFFGSTPLGRGTLHLAAIGALALVFAGIRMGQPEPPPARRRRSPMEHIEALAQAYRSARAEGRLEHLILVGLARRLGHRAPPEAPAAVGSWIRSLPVPPAGREGLTEAWSGPSGPRLAALADAIDRLLNEGRTHATASGPAGPAGRGTA